MDLETEHAGLMCRNEIFNNKDKIEEILSRLSSLGIKITVFVVGELFRCYPNIIKLFEKYNCEFEVHSYTHKTSNVDHEYEIVQAQKAYFDYFNKTPIGYREPCGKITKKVTRLLEKHGFLYDSSIFPSYYPNPFKYISCNRDIHYIKNSNIMEIPLTSISPFRLTLSLSYLKLFGIDFYFNLIRLFGIPNIVCFNTHLHDFIFNEESYNKLPPFWKFIYSRNKFLGVNFCLEFLEFIKQKEYKFCFLSELYEKHRKT